MSRRSQLIRELARHAPYKPSGNPTRGDRIGRSFQRWAIATGVACIALLAFLALRVSLSSTLGGSWRLAGLIAVAIFVVSAMTFSTVDLLLALVQLKNRRGYNAHHDSAAIDHDLACARSLLSYTVEELEDVSIWLTRRVESVEYRLGNLFGQKAPALATIVALLGVWKFVSDPELSHFVPLAPAVHGLLTGALIGLCAVPALVRALCSPYSYQRRLLEIALTQKKRDKQNPLIGASSCSSPLIDSLELAADSTGAER